MVMKKITSLQLQLFERVTPSHIVIKFEPVLAIQDKELIVNKTAYHFQNFVHSVEKVFQITIV